MTTCGESLPACGAAKLRPAAKTRETCTDVVTTTIATRQRTLWVVSELYAPELTSTGYFITRIAEHLARDDSRRVVALASQPTYSARGTRAASAEVLNGVHVHRYWSPALAKDAILGRIANLVAFTAQSAWRLIRSVSAGDIILTVTNPPPVPYIVALIARQRGARVVLLVHDMYPEVIQAGGMAAAQSRVVHIMHRASTWLYRTADRIIVLGRDMRNLVSAKLARDETWRIFLIPNWASLDEIVQTQRAPRRPGSLFTVQHAGNMGRGHNVEILLAAAARLPDVQFAFIGTGAKRAWLEHEVTARALVNVTVSGYRPRNQLSDTLGDCDIAAISFVPGMSGVSVPSRMYNVLASGRPILAVCEPDSELALVVTEEEIGWVVAPGDVDALVDALRQASVSDSSLRQRGLAARRVAERKYSEDTVMNAYDALFASMEIDS